VGGVVIGGDMTREKSMTFGWLVYRIKDGKPEFMGLCQTREKAEEDIEALQGTAMADGWEIAPVPFMGWGYVAPGVFSQNGKPPLKLVD
jgi:hypothetical protein